MTSEGDVVASDALLIGQLSTGRLKWDWVRGTKPGEDGTPTKFIFRCGKLTEAHTITKEKPTAEVLLSELFTVAGLYSCNVTGWNSKGEGPAAAEFPFDVRSDPVEGLPAAPFNPRIVP